MKSLYKVPTIGITALFCIGLQGCSTVGLGEISDSSKTRFEGAALFGGLAALGCGLAFGAKAAALCGLGGALFGSVIGEMVAIKKEDYANKNDYLDARIKVIDKSLAESEKSLGELTQYTQEVTSQIKDLEKEAQRTTEGKEKLLALKNDIGKKLEIAKKNYQTIVKFNAMVKEDIDNKELASLKSYNATKEKHDALNKISSKTNDTILALMKTQSDIKEA